MILGLLRKFSREGHILVDGAYPLIGLFLKPLRDDVHLSNHQEVQDSIKSSVKAPECWPEMPSVSGKENFDD